jgi:hypothetical protein
MDTDAALKAMAAKAVEHAETLRESVRDLTLRALSTREATVEQLEKVLTLVTTGVSEAAAQSNVDPAEIVKGAIEGMDEAVVKLVEANQIALNKLGGEAGNFEASQFKQALDNITHLEDQFLRSVNQAADQAGGQLKNAWAPVLQHMKTAGTQTGTQAQQLAETFTRQAQASRETAFKAAHALTQNYVAVVSGVLMGLAEAYRDKGSKRT